MGLLGRMVSAAEDLIERLGRDRGDVWRSLKHASQRAGELAVRNLELEDRVAALEKRETELLEEVDGLRFNGPTLYSDEIAALKSCVRLEGNPARSIILTNLLFRMDPMPFTQEQVERLAKGNLYDWDEWGQSRAVQAICDNDEAMKPPGFVGTVEEFERFMNVEGKLDPFDPVPDPVECEPISACASHGRCWKHSKWDDSDV